MKGQSKKLSVAAGIFLIFLILIGDFVAGIVGIGSPLSIPTSCPLNSPSPCLIQVQRGSFSITINANGASGSAAAAFSPAYSITPIGHANTNSSFINIGIPQGKIDFFIAEPAAAWANMPSIQTEFLGNTNHRTAYQFTTATNINLDVTCTTASNTLGASLQAQYTTDLTGATGWTNLQTSTALIDNTACPGVSSSVTTLSPTTINGIIVLLRIVGQGGGGVGDNPAFTMLTIRPLQASMNAFIYSTTVSPTQISVSVRFFFRLAATTTLLFSWDAEIQG